MIQYTLEVAAIQLLGRRKLRHRPVALVVQHPLPRVRSGKVVLEVEDIGTPTLKNIDRPAPVSRVRLGPGERPALRRLAAAHEVAWGSVSPGVR